ncbi:hypothetical protein [Streptomyces sp. NPDC006368]|uniref:hypothetical protein n=1 Tax=Streptomyces sp. NPDC006368 TaxID=3156760 RepID=UPI0033AC7196
MRKIRNAALVAAMLGSFSVFGAGVASATDDADSYGDQYKYGNVVVCDQQSRTSNNTYQLGLLNITGPVTILGSGPATATAVQQICSGEDTLAGNGAAAETGAGAEIDLGLLPMA